MDNKGFTLIELLATIVILSLVLGITGVSVVNIINNSKTKSEKLFVDRLSESIDDYIDLKGSTFKKKGSTYTFSKCVDNGCTKTYQVTASLVVKSDGSNITLNDLISEGILDKAKVVNPRNKKNCLSGKNPVVSIYRDSEFVYYYYLDLSGSNTSCEVEENAIINTLPSDLSEKVGYE